MAVAAQNGFLPGFVPGDPPAPGAQLTKTGLELAIKAGVVTGAGVLAPGAAGALARSPNALAFGSSFGVGFTDGFNSGVPGGPGVFTRIPGAPIAINAGLISGRIAGKAAGFAGRFDPVPGPLPLAPSI